MKRYFVGSTLLAVSLGLSGCGSDSKPFTATTDSSLKNQDNVRAWVNGGSAFAVYGNVYLPIGVADGQETFADPDCPVVLDDGTTLFASGGCSEAGGTEWVGSATVDRLANGDRTLTLDDFGTRTDATHSDTKKGEAHLRRIDATNQDFDVTVTHSAGLITTFDYAGHVQGDYDTSTVWSGSGTVTREGVIAPNGTVDVSTTDEIIDKACSAPMSGNTTVHNMADETVVVTYDGALDCDDAQAASYSLNGDAKGQITGISCMISPGAGSSGAGPRTALSLLLAAVGALWCGRRERRRERRHQP